MSAPIEGERELAEVADAADSTSPTQPRAVRPDEGEWPYSVEPGERLFAIDALTSLTDGIDGVFDDNLGGWLQPKSIGPSGAIGPEQPTEAVITWQPIAPDQSGADDRPEALQHFAIVLVEVTADEADAISEGRMLPRLALVDLDKPIEGRVGRPT